VLGLALVLIAPSAALGQHVRVFDGRSYALAVPAPANHEVRVTIVNPALAAPPDTSAAQVDYFLKLTTVDGEATTAVRTIGPGEAYSFTLDPRAVGEVVEPRTGLRRVIVGFHVEAEVVEGRCAPQPAVTIELVNVRTREAQTVQSYPGFAGGVFVAAGDVD
jgi:hypothetical protein